MNKVMTSIGVGLLLLLAWDVNFYLVHVPWPSWLFWDGAYPLALGFYVLSAGYLIAKGAKS